MGNAQSWNDESREELREALKARILGELRLASQDHKGILNTCREVHIQDECPDEERGTFIRFAAKELKRESILLESAKTRWPKVTDCDRLDRVEATLRDQGILLWQVSPCCDTCTCGELSERINVVNGRYPGFRDRIRGYAFFIDQNMPDELAESTKLTIYLGYGWCSPDGSEVDQKAYERNALGIAKEVCKCLRNERLKVIWNGKLARKIQVSLNWRRRTLLK